MCKLQINYVWKLYWKISICLNMAMEDKGEIVPKIAGGAHPVEPRWRAWSIEWPRRSPMASPPARRGMRRARRFLFIFCIFCIFYNFEHIQHILHTLQCLHILHLHILHILQELHNISLMYGWQDNMLASGKEGTNEGPAAVPASAAGPASITSDAWPRCSCTNAATACLLWIANHIKALPTMLSSLALHCSNWPWPICFNMQNMPENMQK